MDLFFQCTLIIEVFVEETQQEELHRLVGHGPTAHTPAQLRLEHWQLHMPRYSMATWDCFIEKTV